MSILPHNASSSVIDFMDDAPDSIKMELKNRYDELTQLELKQTELSTSIPQLYGSITQFVANPSTVSVETYKRMLDTDETIGSGIDFMNIAFLSRWGDYKHPSKEITQFVNRALEQMDTPWHMCLDEMFSAEWAGFSVTEKVWDFKHDFDGMPAFVPRKLVTMPPLTVVFAVDRTGEVLDDGIYQYQMFNSSFINSNLLYAGGSRYNTLDGFRPDMLSGTGDLPYPLRIATNLAYMAVKMPKNKVIHLKSSSTGKFNNPYGRSILRRAYKNWVSKDAFIKMWIVAADKRGTPLLIGYASPNDTVLEGHMQGEGGSVGAAPERADVAMARTMSTIHNNSFVVFPGRKTETYEVEAIQSQGDMTVYKDGIEYWNKGLMRALLIPPLVMSAGDGAGSYALGAEHNRIFKQIIDGKLKFYKKAILSQFIKEIISYNFPKKLWERDGLGEFLQEDYDPEVSEKLANIYSTLTTSGYMNASDQVDMNSVREKIGLPKKQAQEAQPQPSFGGLFGEPEQDSKEGDNENESQEPSDIPQKEKESLPEQKSEG